MKVKELVNQLNRLDPEAQALIVDADTGWYLCIELVSIDQLGDYPITVLIQGSYNSIFHHSDATR
jgi:hypothetical protein